MNLLTHQQLPISIQGFNQVKCCTRKCQYKPISHIHLILVHFATILFVIFAIAYFNSIQNHNDKDDTFADSDYTRFKMFANEEVWSLQVALY